MTSNYRKDLYATYVSTFKHALPVAEDAKEQRDYWAWARVKLLPLIADVSRDAPVLELGAGSGKFLWILRREGFREVRGIDVSDEMVSLAQAARLPVEKADVFEFLNEDQTKYGLIVGLDFIEHFTKAELMRLLPAIRERLRPDGVLLVQAPNAAGLLPNNTVHGDMTHSVVLTPQSFEQLLQNLGFTEVRFAETGPVPKNLRGAVRVALWSVIRTVANAVRIIETGRPQPVWTENFICR
ncbi:MAG: class I SAM-dependent methyltransferase, partial [Myxococcota bacterium]